ncbi:hypothetical protein PBI_FLOOF_8 [Microbacterium phage Floof]|uniref:Uncharacterized protein n=1 Tax=Microbacterium phage Floof TaxID=2201433 RepID=A0A2Z4Q4J2_9CAUD|nr:hypothetical protein PBI_FLOOF_8 [Microbacterium phage Floof]
MIPAPEDLAATIFVPVDGSRPVPFLAVGDPPLPGKEDTP